MNGKNYKQKEHPKGMKRGVNRKGQLAVFVIVAIVILAIILVFLLYPKIKFQTSGAFIPQNYLRDCVQPELTADLNTITSQGGYLQPEGFLLYNDTKVKFLCYTPDYYKPCIIQQPMILEQVQNELYKAIQPKLVQCTQNLKSEYERQGYSVSAGNPETQIEIVPGKINVKFKSPMTITKELSQTFTEFDVGLTSQMYDLLSISTSILQFESSYGDSETTLYLQYYPNLMIEKTKLSDGTKLYRVSDVTTKESFTFATRSLSWPPGYALSV